MRRFSFTQRRGDAEFWFSFARHVLCGSASLRDFLLFLHYVIGLCHGSPAGGNVGGD